MKIAYLDCFSGISGDMFLGTLVDAGVPLQLLEDTVRALNVGARLEVSRVLRSGISATKLDVIIAGQKDLPREVYLAQRAAEAEPAELVQLESNRVWTVGELEEKLAEISATPQFSAHEAHHHHTHAHPHHGHNEPGPQGSDHPHRGLSEICEIIRATALTDTARQRAIRIFEALGAAEAKIHDVPIEDIHFHEVGAADAIVDIVCAAVGSEYLGVDEWVCSPLNVGGGTVDCAHGTFPVPAPATLALLNQCGAPVYSSGIQKELVTPTGAAIVSVLASRFGPFPSMKISGGGYGAGYRDIPRHANVLRLTIGEATGRPTTGESGVHDLSSTLKQHRVSVLEANIDDLSPQVFGYLIDRALAAGALDVFTTAATMKKSRPGLLLTVLCPPERREDLARLIFAETSTIGIRMRDEQRFCLERSHESVTTPWGEVRLKVASLDGTVTNYAPEYEDCRRIAEQHKIPLKTVITEAVRQYLERHHE